MPIFPVPTPREPPPEEEGEYDLSALSDPDEEDEDEGDPEPESPPVLAEPEPTATMPKRRGRQPRKPQEQKPIGVGATIREPKTYWKDRNLEVLWPEVISYLQSQHRTPWEVDIRVKRTEPQEMLIGQPFNGGTVMGSNGQAAATQIVDKVTDEYHLVSGSPGPASYKVEIIWRVNSKVLTWGTLRLASPDAIMGMRRMQHQQPGPPPWQGPIYPSSPPYAGYGVSPSPYPPSYGGFGAPPTPPAPPAPNEEAAMRAEIGYLRGTLDEVMRAFREGRQPNIAPMPAAGVGASPQPDMIESVARRVVEMLRPGFGATPVMATPAAVPAATPAVSTFEASVQTIMQGMMQGVLKKVGQSVEQAIRGDGTSAQPTEAVAEVVTENPQEHLPFESIPVGSKWPDGRDVIFPRDKETGSVNAMGILFANPFLSEKMADAASNFVGNVGDLVKNMGKSMSAPGASEVVQNIPRGAVQAGVGQPQQPQAPRVAPPPAQVAPPPAPAAPRPNGVVASQPDNGGWPTG